MTDTKTCDPRTLREMVPARLFDPSNGPSRLYEAAKAHILALETELRKIRFVAERIFDIDVWEHIDTQEGLHPELAEAPPEKRWYTVVLAYPEHRADFPGESYVGCALARGSDHAVEQVRQTAFREAGGDEETPDDWEGEFPVSAVIPGRPMGRHSRPIPLTPQTSSECPSCGSEETTGGPVTIDGNEAAQEMLCADCGAEWEDKYKRVGYTNFIT